MKPSCVFSFFSLLLVGVTYKQTTIFRFEVPPKKPVYHIASLASFLRNPERMPIYIPIQLLNESPLTVAETLARQGSYPYNPELGLYGHPSKHHTHHHQRDNATTTTVEEPNLFDLIAQFNARASHPLNKDEPSDPIELVAVCEAWEQPARVYTRAQLADAKASRVDPCDVRPWWCKQRCEFVPTVGDEPFEPPACAKAYEGMDGFSEAPKREGG
ncbi:uncharacterized protein F4807DRAFT_467547 [Annulohypoxylon truncatum]|uniref:uncharacterized protein n=1 Tax=Annulohypoxylon truncatum TaxID=327061 RepID=UPI00200740B2|nr:uncharacterized protein F4807DRAFT_467547 [Annulohypoxylon truncatum]KAI1209645.1 hypothetical protein F4807DRAFT_467547 [Annulohypoxylon truncatum]